MKTFKVIMLRVQRCCSKQYWDRMKIVAVKAKDRRGAKAAARKVFREACPEMESVRGEDPLLVVVQ